MRTITVVTASRSDYGIYLPVLRRIQEDPELELHLLVTGMHLSPEFGLTVGEIEQSGFDIGGRIEMLLSSDNPEGIAKSTGLGTIGFGQAYAQFRPDILLVLGDRFEMHAAVIAALPYKIPVAHIHGGESTEGAMDEQIRHSITKMSHLHFASTEVYAQRIIQMGEEPWRVVVAGAPGLDNLVEHSPLSREEFRTRFDLDLTDSFLLVTYHPVTLEYEQTGTYTTELLRALDDANLPVIFTYPNSDTSGRFIKEMIEEFVTRRGWAQVSGSLGTQGYFSLMEYATAMVGNSSSGIIEAPSFKLPVVNIGSRQQGRIFGRNVIHVDTDRTAILAGIQKAVSPSFQASLDDLINPYGDCRAAERIIQKLKITRLDDNLIVKRFYHKGNGC